MLHRRSLATHQAPTGYHLSSVRAVPHVQSVLALLLYTVWLVVWETVTGSQASVSEECFSCSVHCVGVGGIVVTWEPRIIDPVFFAFFAIPHFSSHLHFLSRFGNRNIYCVEMLCIIGRLYAGLNAYSIKQLYWMSTTYGIYTIALYIFILYIMSQVGPNHCVVEQNMAGTSITNYEVGS